VARSNLAALSTSTGAATAWNPSPDAVVHTILPSGTLVYVGGEFEHIGGQTHSALAAVSPSTGSATTWDAGVRPPSGQTPGVFSLALDGGTLYATGYFRDLGGQVRAGLGGVSASTGLATAWDPWPDGFPVHSVAADSSVVYAGGEWREVNLAPAGGFARFTSPPTGAATAPVGQISVSAPAQPASGEAVPIAAGGSAGYGALVYVYAEPGGTSCAADPATETSRSGVVQLVVGKEVYGAFLQQAALHAASGAGYLVCAYLTDLDDQLVAHASTATVGPPPSPGAPAPPPSVQTSPASGLTDTSAVLNGTVDPNGTATQYHFE
jgi:hypothetical protein